MKRIFIIVGLVLGFQVAKGQDMGGAVSESTYLSMKRRIQKTDEDIQDAKKNVLAKTWFNRGTVMQDAFEINNTKILAKNLNSALLQAYLKEPLKTETKQLPDGTKEEVYEYYGLTVTIHNGTVFDWEETESAVDNPLDKAYEAFMKAEELDADKKLDKKMKTQLTDLKDQYKRLALYNYEKGKFADSYHDFSQMLSIEKTPYINTPNDTLVMYFSGIAAYQAKDYKDAITGFQQAKELHYPEPMLFYYQEQSYIGMGDTASAVATIKEGNTVHPNNNVLVIELVNLYIRMNESKQAIEYLNKAKTLDPTNKTLYFAEGTLWDKLDNPDSAKAAYEKAISIDPNYFDATYNLGVFYYNNAVKLYEVANKESDTKIYLEKKTIADEELKKAVPIMERAHEINPTDKSTMTTLKTLYYRLKMEDKLKAIKAELGE